jgi:hypothetical protein
VVTIDQAKLTADLATAGLTTGTPITAGEARRLACGAGILPAVLDGKSQPLDPGPGQTALQPGPAQGTRHPRPRVPGRGLRHPRCLVRSGLPPVLRTPSQWSKGHGKVSR